MKISKVIKAPLAAILTTVIGGGCANYAQADEGYTQFYTPVAPISGGLNYTGGAVGEAKTTILPLTMRQARVHVLNCNFSGTAYMGYLRRDMWYGIPTAIRGLGPIRATIQEGFQLVDHDSTRAYYLRHGETRPLNKHEVGACAVDGEIETDNFEPQDTPTIGIAVDVSHMGIGTYTGSIDMTVAGVQYYSVDCASCVEREGVGRYTATRYMELVSIPYNINITNRCSVSPTALRIEHGGLSISSAEGDRRNQGLTITCDGAGVVKATLQATTPSSNAYADAVGVSLGHGWDSKLSMSTAEQPQAAKEVVQRVEKGVPMRVVVASMLTGGAEREAGELNGSAVLTLDLE